MLYTSEQLLQICDSRQSGWIMVRNDHVPNPSADVSNVVPASGAVESDGVWKLHLSIAPEDMAKAIPIIHAQFCHPNTPPMGMKVASRGLLAEDHQSGKEVALIFDRATETSTDGRQKILLFLSSLAVKLETAGIKPEEKPPLTVETERQVLANGSAADKKNIERGKYDATIKFRENERLSYFNYRDELALLFDDNVYDDMVAFADPEERQRMIKRSEFNQWNVANHPQYKHNPLKRKDDFLYGIVLEQHLSFSPSNTNVAASNVSIDSLGVNQALVINTSSNEVFSKDYEVIYQNLSDLLAQYRTDQNISEGSLLELHNQITREKTQYQAECFDLLNALQLETELVHAAYQQLVDFAQRMNNWSLKYWQMALDLELLTEITLPEFSNPLDSINIRLNSPIERTTTDVTDNTVGNIKDIIANHIDIDADVMPSAGPEDREKQLLLCEIDLNEFQSRLTWKAAFLKHLHDHHQLNQQHAANFENTRAEQHQDAINFWLPWHKAQVARFRRPEVVEAFTIQEQHISQLQNSNPSDRLTLIKNAAPQARLMDVCNLYCDNFTLQPRLTFGKGQGLLSFFFQALDLYPIDARKTYITADLIRRAATAFPREELARLLTYYPGNNLLSLLQEPDDQGHNALYYATVTPDGDGVNYDQITSIFMGSYVFNRDRCISILNYYPETERYSALIQLREDGFRIERCNFLDQVQSPNLLPRLDYLRFSFDRTMSPLETENEQIQDPRIQRLVSELRALKPQLFNQDIEIHRAAAKRVSELLNQAEVDFLDDPAYSFFHIVARKIISICADVVRFFSESYYEKLQEYNKTNAQKIYDSANLRFCFFGSDPSFGIVHDAEVEIQRLVTVQH